MSTPQDTAPQRRKSWTASRRQILDAASACFAERGYRAATTRDIAQRAGVSEMTVFRHFPAKGDLFDAAVLEPVRVAIDEYLATHHGTDGVDRTLENKTTDFFDGLLELTLGDGRPLTALAAALATYDADSEEFVEIRTVMDHFLDSLEDLFRRRLPVHGFAVDPKVAPRLLFGLALSVGLHGNWLFPADGRPDRDALIRELTKLTVWGLRGAP